MFGRKPKKIKIRISFELKTKKLQVVIRPDKTKPTVAMELLLEAVRLIEQGVKQELEKLLPEETKEKEKKLGYID